MADETTTTGTETSTTGTPTNDAPAATTTESGATSSDAGDVAGGAAETSVLGSAQTDTGARDGSDSGAETGKDGADDAGKNDPVVPEKYEISLTVKGEDGSDQAVEIDPALLETATPVLKDLGLTNDQANKVASLVPQVQQRFMQQQADDFAATKTQWAKEASEDSEIGGKNWKQTQTLAAKALDHFGAPADSDFRKLLNETGLGNHPVMIKMFRNVGAALSEETTFAQGDGRVGKADRLSTLYPNDVPEAQKAK